MKSIKELANGTKIVITANLFNHGYDIGSTVTIEDTSDWSIIGNVNGVVCIGIRRWGGAGITAWRSYVYDGEFKMIRSNKQKLHKLNKI